MYILRQGGEKIFNMDRVRDVNIFGKVINADGMILGQYESGERCKEIFVEIIKCIDLNRAIYKMPKE